MASEYKVGQRILVLADGKNWVLGDVLEVGKNYAFKVHYDGWDAAYDEVKKLEDCTLGGAKIADPSKVTVGTNLKVSWLGMWYDATVLEVVIHRVKVTFDNCPATFTGAWVGDNQVKPAPDTSQSKDGDYSVGQKVSIFRSKRWIPSTVVEIGSPFIYEVTYDGWGDQYDECVSPEKCKLRNGQRIGSDPKVIKKGCQLNILWADGNWYAATVLNVGDGVAKVHCDGMPPELDGWVFATQIKPLEGVAGAKSNVAKSQDIPDQPRGKFKKIEHKKVVTGVEKFDETDAESKWQEMLKSKLLPQGTIKEMESKIKSSKKPAWSGKPLPSDEYEASIAATDEDMEYAEMLAKILEKRGIKVTTDVDKVHDSRVFVVIYSDSTARDENVVRHLTRAAERFNSGETIIVPVIRSGCTPRVLDKIPDNIAYSLSNTNFINMASFHDPLQKTLQTRVNELADVIRHHAREETDWNLTGLWCCQAIVTDERSGQSLVKDFFVLLQQDGTKITGKSTHEWKISGEVKNSIVTIKFEYRGEWTQHTEGTWEEKDYMMVGEISAIVTNQGYRLEGNYAHKADAGNSEVPGVGYQRCSLVGLFNATLERNGLSGLYLCDFGDNDPSYIGIVHLGGNEVILDLPWAYGVRFNGFYDTITKNINITSPHQFYSWTIYGIVQCDDSKSTVIKGPFSYVDSSGVTQPSIDVTMKRDEIHQKYVASAKSHGDDANLMKMYKMQPERKLPIPFIPHVYKPITSDEFAVIICCTSHEKKHAEKLKKNLEDMEVTPVTLDLKNAQKARTLILLLSSHTQESKELIDIVSEAAEEEKPIFNIGLDSWFSIFGEKNWKDQELREQLMNALARLNQTPDTTLDRNHSNFYGLVKGIKKYTHQPIFYLTGLWELEYIGENTSRYTDINAAFKKEPEMLGGEPYEGNIDTPPAGSQKKCPAIIFIYFNHGANEVLSATDFVTTGVTGSFDTTTCTLHMTSTTAIYEFQINASSDVMLGHYINKVTKRKYKVMASYCSDGLSGLYEYANTMIGITQSGDGVGTVVTYEGVFPATVSNGQLVYHMSMPAEYGGSSTIAAMVNEYADGIRLEGYMFLKKQLLPRISFRAVQRVHRLNRIIKKGNQKSEAPQSVLKLVDNFFSCRQKRDHKAVMKLLSPIASDNYPLDVFLKEAKDAEKMEGKLIPKSARLVGIREMSSGGQKIGQTRYEFDLDFERRKDYRFSFLIQDSDGLVAGLESLEEEAVSQHFSEYDVMISYRSWDARWVDLLQEYLEKHGVVVWRDRRMEVGVNWSEDITRAVRKSGCVISCISENYLASVLCTKEVRMATEVGRSVIPLVLPETQTPKGQGQRMVSSHYKGKHLPHSVAHELSGITWIDFREVSKLNEPDPTDLKSFEKKYGTHLQMLVDTVCEINGLHRVSDLTGEWLIEVGVGADKEEVILNITEMDGNKLNGTLTLVKFRCVEFELDNYSYFRGSYLRVSGTTRLGVLTQTFVLTATLATGGNVFNGNYQMFETPIEVTIGEKVNMAQLMKYKNVKNGCYRQPAKGVRKGVGADLRKQFLSKFERWALDMDMAKEIIPDEKEVEELLKAFNVYDRDGSSALDLDELDLAVRMSGTRATKKQLLEMMEEVDLDKSGYVDFYEFLEIMKKTDPKRGKVKTSKATGWFSKGVLSQKGSGICAIQ